MLEYAVRKSYDELLPAILESRKDTNNDLLRKDLNYRLGTFLHWSIDMYEKQSDKFNNLVDNDKEFISGLRFANNQLKHNKTVIELCEGKGGTKLPFQLPSKLEAPNYFWKIEIDKDEDIKYINQYQNYINQIDGKSVRSVADNIMNLLFKS